MAAMPVAAPSPARHDRIDALRGAAMVWMTVFHFCFDLAHFRLTQQNFYMDPFWTVQRTAIVSLFLFCAGLGQAVAVAQGQGWPRFWRRWAQVVGAALLVTAGSIVMFPLSYITFGVLHGIAVMLVIARLSAGWGGWLWPAGLAAIVLPELVTPLLQQQGWGPLIDSRWLNWLGFVTGKPPTEDYVPLLPWLGVVWWGLAAGQWLLARHPGVVQAPVGAPGRALARLGRWSLTYYLAHQSVMIGLLSAWLALRR